MSDPEGKEAAKQISVCVCMCMCVCVCVCMVRQRKSKPMGEQNKVRNGKYHAQHVGVSLLRVTNEEDTEGGPCPGRGASPRLARGTCRPLARVLVAFSEMM